MTKRNATPRNDAARASELLKGKVVSLVRLPRDKTVLVEFEDGTRLFVDAVGSELELSITESGDPSAQPGLSVSLLGYRPGANTVEGIMLVRRLGGLSLAAAKAKIEALLEGESVQVMAQSSDAANELVRELEACGFSARQNNDPSVGG
jgi:ribosomal protein L7/L12